MQSNNRNHWLIPKAQHDDAVDMQILLQNYQIMPRFTKSRKSQGVYLN